MWDLPGSGPEPGSPTLVGGFFTSELSGKPPLMFLRKDWLTESYLLLLSLLYQKYLTKHTKGFLSGSLSKESAYNAGDEGSIPGSGRSPGGENGNPLQYSCLENTIDRGVWQATQSMRTQRAGQNWACTYLLSTLDRQLSKDVSVVAQWIQVNCISLTLRFSSFHAIRNFCFQALSTIMGELKKLWFLTTFCPFEIQIHAGQTVVMRLSEAVILKTFFGYQILLQNKVLRHTKILAHVFRVFKDSLIKRKRRRGEKLLRKGSQLKRILGPHLENHQWWKSAQILWKTKDKSMEKGFNLIVYILQGTDQKKKIKVCAHNF